MSLQTDINDRVLQLKDYIVENSYKIAIKESYGEDVCKCKMSKIKLAIAYVEILECYNVNVPEANCLDETEIGQLMQHALKLIMTDC
jgi:hypothetical protein